MPDPLDDPVALRGEITRLRELVGPEERAYHELADDLATAVTAARDAELEAGRLRGRIAELLTQLDRARQDQERFQSWLDARRSVVERVDAVRRRFVRAG